MDNVTITFRTKEETKKQLDNIALNQNRTLSNLIETIILMYLDNYEEIMGDDDSNGLTKMGEVGGLFQNKKDAENG